MMFDWRELARWKQTPARLPMTASSSTARTLWTIPNEVITDGGFSALSACCRLADPELPLEAYGSRRHRD